MNKEDLEKLAFAQALYQKLGEIVSTKDPDSLRGLADEFYREMYETTGAKSFEVKIDGEKVGTYSVRVSKAKPSTTEEHFTVTDEEKLSEWVSREINYDLAASFVFAHLERFAGWYFTETGEVPYGCELEQTVTLAQPARYSGGALKVDPMAVLGAMQGKLGPSVAGILGGGE